jgi:hypothetical protein
MPLSGPSRPSSAADSHAAACSHMGIKELRAKMSERMTPFHKVEVEGEAALIRKGAWIGREWGGDEMGWDRIGSDGMGSDRGRYGMGWDETGWDGMR